MGGNMKRVLFLTFLFLFMMFSYSLKVDALVPTKDFYVNDYANILSEETEKFILDHSVSLANATKAQIVVVTVKSLEGQDIEIFANEVFNSFGIGDAKENNGLLLLLAYEEREFRVEVGYGFEELLPDGLTGRYQDTYIIPFLKHNRYDEGIVNGYSAFYKKICEYYHISSNDVTVNRGYSSTHNSSVLDEEEEELPTFFDEANVLQKTIIIFCYSVGFSFGALLIFYPFIFINKYWHRHGELLKKYNKIIKAIVVILMLNVVVLFLTRIFDSNLWYLESSSTFPGRMSLLKKEAEMVQVGFCVAVLILIAPHGGGHGGLHTSHGHHSRGGGGHHGGGGRSGGGGSSRHF